MSKHLAGTMAALLVAVTLLTCASVPAAAQVDPEGGGQAFSVLARLRSNSTGPAPRTADGKPDLSERYRRTDSGHLDFEVTIDDPGAYTRPFTLYGQAPLLNTEIMEYVCNENNEFVEHIVGKDLRK
jgi:hypothetical protein